MSFSIKDHIERIPKLVPFFNNVVIFARYCQQNHILFKNKEEGYYPPEADTIKVY